MKDRGIRLCLFRNNIGKAKEVWYTFECYCDEKTAIASLNFIRFLD